MVEHTTDRNLGQSRKVSRRPAYVARSRLAILIAGGTFIGMSAPSVMSAPLPPVIDSIQAEEVPLFSPEEAWQLAHEPRSRMIDDTTCERVEGVYLQGSEGSRTVVADSVSALFRSRHRGTPFLRVRTRKDGVLVVQFPATPNEIITSRSYRFDERTKRHVYGRPFDSVCQASEVKVGGPTPIQEGQ